MSDYLHNIFPIVVLDEPSLTVIYKTKVADGHVWTIQERKHIQAWCTFWQRDSNGDVLVREWKGHQIPMLLMSYEINELEDDHNSMVSKVTELLIENNIGDLP